MCCLNIGGIANFTSVTPEFRKVLAFDTGPGNMAIDGAVRILTRGREEMDTDGEMAAKGMIIDEFLEYLLDHPYFEKLPPKSTGREEFGVNLSARRAGEPVGAFGGGPGRDGHRGGGAFNPRGLRSLYQAENPAEHIIVGGAGRNKALMKRLKAGFNGAQVFTSDQYGIPIAAREAIAFAILATSASWAPPPTCRTRRARRAGHPRQYNAKPERVAALVRTGAACASAAPVQREDRGLSIVLRSLTVLLVVV